MLTLAEPNVWPPLTPQQTLDSSWNMHPNFLFHLFTFLWFTDLCFGGRLMKLSPIQKLYVVPFPVFLEPFGSCSCKLGTIFGGKNVTLRPIFLRFTEISDDPKGHPAVRSWFTTPKERKKELLRFSAGFCLWTARAKFICFRPWGSFVYLRKASHLCLFFPSSGQRVK